MPEHVTAEASRTRMPRWLIPVLVFGAVCPILTMFVLWVGPLSHGLTHTQGIAVAMRGFANMWFAGSVATTQPDALSDPSLYTSLLRNTLGTGFPSQAWGYPPSMLFIAVPLSMLPLLMAFTLWTVTGIFLFHRACARAGDRALPQVIATVCMLSPALAENALSGQTGALAGAVLLAGLLGTRTPAASGILLGLLSLKPQMGLLLPVHLWMSGRLLTLLWAGLSAVGLAALSLLVFGWQPWHAFLSGGGGVGSMMQAPWSGAPAQTGFTSPFMAFRALAAPLWMAWTLQGCITLVCIITCSYASRNKASAARKRELLPLQVGLVIALDLLATPYSHAYDMPALAVVVAMLCHDRLRHGPLCGALRFLELPFLCMAWVWPGAMVMLPALIPDVAWCSPVLGATSLAGTSWVAWTRLHAARHRTSENPGHPGLAGNNGIENKASLVTQ